MAQQVRRAPSVMDNDYDPWENRDIEHPTSNFGAFTHLIKGCLGAGILAMPKAFSHSGWVFGTVATLVTGICTTYCINMLIWSLVAEMKRNRLPLMTYSEACESAFNSGPKYAKKTSRCAKHSADVFLCIQLLGICAVYVLFAASNVQEILEYYGYHINFRYCIVAIWPVLILMSLIKTLKFLAPMSLVANILIILGMLIIYYNFFETMHSLDERPMIQKDWIRIPLFFGIVVFSLEGIGVVVSIENAMQNSRALIHGPCVLNVAMAIVTIMYLFTGFFGFLRYGNESDDNVSKNLPFNIAGIIGKCSICLGIFLSYCIQFYPPVEVIWNMVKDRIPEKRVCLYNTLLRIALVSSTVIAALSIPNLGIMMSMMGSLCLSVLGFVFPPLMELFSFYPERGYGIGGYRIIINGFFITFGFFAMFSGLYSNTLEILNIYQEDIG